MIYEENGEEKLIDMLKHLFPDVDSTKRFLNFCTTFLIVQNMAWTDVERMTMNTL